jgi:hydrogenase maturation factor HypF (carbamoyltransferase family)
MVTAADRALLEGPRRPIVLLPRRADSAVAQSVAPGNARLGAMLPYTPLHHLLLDESIEALVMTSGNMSEEPIVSRNEEAWPRLHTLADYFLLHNRAIRTRVDDSVFQIFEGREYPVRRSRGYAPDPIEMGTVEKYSPLVFFVTFRDPQGHDSTLEKHLSPYGGPRECQGRRIANPPQVNNLPHVDPAFFITVGGPEAHQGRSEICPTGLPEVLACGGELKNTFCLIKEPYAILSQHIGDLENLETMEFFRETLEHLRRFFRVTPVAVAHDLHPGYLSTRFALNESGLPAIGVQHHHAHIASCMADNGIEGKVIGVALDGTGYGTDGMIWGGEFLVADFLDFERCGHLRYVPLAGGDSGVRQPWRSALAYLRDAFGEDARSLPLALFREVPAKHLRVVEAMIARNIQTVATSSCGRLFDAVSSLLGIRHETSYEGQAAIELEAAASSCSGSYPFAIEDGAPFQVDLRTLIEAIVRDSTDGVATGEISARFHLTMANVIAACCERVRQSHGLTRVCLSGGTFQNLRLLSHTTALLREQGFDVFTHHQVPTNDGGLALGQALIAAKVAAHRSFL